MNLNRLGILLSFLLTLGLAQAQEDELLPPEEAFALRAWVEGDTLVADFRIAPGYYMYRERFEFEIEEADASTRFAEMRIPDGKVKQDEFFGETEVYRDAVRIELPLQYEGPRANQLQIKATSQG